MSRALLILAPLALIACGEEKKVEAPPAKPPIEINLAPLETPKDQLPAGWMATTLSQPNTRFFAEDGKIFFDFPGKGDAAVENTLSYEIDPALAGEVTFEFGYTQTGESPECQVGLTQGDKGGKEKPTKRNISMKLEKTAGEPALASFSCKASSEVYGYLIQPRLRIVEK